MSTMVRWRNFMRSRETSNACYSEILLWIRVLHTCMRYYRSILLFWKFSRSRVDNTKWSTWSDWRIGASRIIHRCTILFQEQALPILKHQLAKHASCSNQRVSRGISWRKICCRIPSSSSCHRTSHIGTSHATRHTPHATRPTPLHN